MCANVAKIQGAKRKRDAGDDQDVEMDVDVDDDSGSDNGMDLDDDESAPGPGWCHQQEGTKIKSADSWNTRRRSKWFFLTLFCVFLICACL